MNRVIHRALTALGMVVVLILGSANTAQAAPTDVAAQLALSCPSGSVCVWPYADGRADRCSWVNSDNDWFNAPAVCSWSVWFPVKAIYNNGQSSSYGGVCVYYNSGYQDVFRYLSQRGGSWTSGTGAYLRSHRWVAIDQWC
jgi:hypothetical protein